MNRRKAGTTKNVEQRASKGNAYVGPREMFESIAHNLGTEARWEDVAELVENDEIGVFIRTEPVGEGHAVTMRVARPSEIRSGEFYAQLAVDDNARGITVLDGRKPLAGKVVPLAEVGEMRRMFSAAARECSNAVPLDDFVVDGEIGVIMYASPMPGSVEVRIELEYVKPAEVRLRLAEPRS